MTNPRPSDPNAPNLLLMLEDHLPNAIRASKATITRLERQLVDERATLEILIRHAAVANIVVDDEPELTA